MIIIAKTSIKYTLMIYTEILDSNSFTVTDIRTYYLFQIVVLLETVILYFPGFSVRIGFSKFLGQNACYYGHYYGHKEIIVDIYSCTFMKRTYYILQDFLYGRTDKAFHRNSWMYIIFCTSIKYIYANQNLIFCQIK